MHRQTIVLVFTLLMISIVARNTRRKLCIRNLLINGTNLMTTNRKRLLVLGIVNFSDQSSRIQANRLDINLNFEA